MPDETKKLTRKPSGWTAARQHLATWDKPALLALVKDLYDSAAANRDFIHGRCQTEESGGEVLERYRATIAAQFFPARGIGTPKLAEARKAIRDYRSSTGSLPGTVELLMTYVECGAEFTIDYWASDDRFYRSVELALDELAALLRGAARDLYPQFSARLARVDQRTGGIGWGFHDFVADVVGGLEKQLGTP